MGGRDVKVRGLNINQKRLPWLGEKQIADRNVLGRQVKKFNNAHYKFRIFSYLVL